MADALARAFRELLVDGKPSAKLTAAERDQLAHEVQVAIEPRLEQIRREQRRPFPNVTIDSRNQNG